MCKHEKKPYSLKWNLCSAISYCGEVWLKAMCDVTSSLGIWWSGQCGRLHAAWQLKLPLPGGSGLCVCFMLPSNQYFGTWISPCQHETNCLPDTTGYMKPPVGFVGQQSLGRPMCLRCQDATLPSITIAS